jgi:hypothetical protein
MSLSSVSAIGNALRPAREHQMPAVATMRDVHQCPAFAFLYKPARVLYPVLSIRLSTMVGAFRAGACAGLARLTAVL